MKLLVDGDDEALKDYWMTQTTFGVSSSSFAANKSVKQKVLDHAQEFPLAVAAVHDSYMDDSLAGADSVESCQTPATTTGNFRSRRVFAPQVEVQRTCCA